MLLDYALVFALLKHEICQGGENAAPDYERRIVVFDQGLSNVLTVYQIQGKHAYEE